ncbi:GspH/FimT family pseudopilin [Salinisphaera sp. SPP-AMP-43]|uniref:GspH/FimT family pseudopilin n=1 Tax=Salinisphaera sp. SPP-AMP-43 TaxID=3121288 RepID=UPI003C6DFF74
MGDADSRGFTLLELLVTMAVAVILVTVAVPSYRGIVARNTLAANVNDLIGALNYARSEAVSRGRTVYVCASHDQRSCSHDGDWSRGWLVYAPDPRYADDQPNADNRLRVHGATGSGFAVTSADPSPLSFNANGFAISGRTFEARSDDTATTIAVASSGRVEAQS